jgi:hypothetical protein
MQSRPRHGYFISAGADFGACVRTVVAVRAVKAGETMDAHDIFCFKPIEEIWQVMRVVEKRFLGPLGWRRWLAVSRSRSVFLMEARKSRYWRLARKSVSFRDARPNGVLRTPARPAIESARYMHADNHDGRGDHQFG